MLEGCVPIGKGRIQSIGGSLCSLVPAVYRKFVRLEKGDTVDLFFEGNNKLIIKPAKDDGEGAD
ncbi:MAG: hypothetical protein E3J35_03790 [Methanomassiliicoccales archaeon]|nr:MAG: hypothetical protein E3J35_03790 [Methanomassiliicoccales archaeon]